MTTPQRAQARLVILMVGVVAAFLAYAVWLGANQCIKVGGCG
jgi:hypothetical protein